MADPSLLIGKLDSDELDKLERRLAIKTESIQVLRGSGSAEEPVEQTALAATTQDIMDTYSRGVTIAPQTESHLLIPLFEAAGKPVPPEMRVDHDRMGYEFYSVEVIFTVRLPENEYARSAAFSLRINDDITDPARKTRPIQLFPGRQDVLYFSADFEGAIGIDADMKLSLPLSAAGLAVPIGQFSPSAKLKAGIVVGPFSFPFRKAAIEVVGEQSQDVHWSYNLQTTLEGANTFKSILILKVAAEAKTIYFDADLKIAPFKKSWFLFTDPLPVIPVHGRLVVELDRPDEHALTPPR